MTIPSAARLYSRLRCLRFALSFASLVIAGVLLFAVPSFYIGRAAHGIAKVSISENAIAASTHAESFTNVNISGASDNAASLLRALCSGIGIGIGGDGDGDGDGHGPHRAASWFADALKDIGADAEWRAVKGGSAFAYGILRAGAGAAGTAAIVFAAAGPSAPGDVWGSGAASPVNVCGEKGKTTDKNTVAAPHGALLLLSVARVLYDQRWRNSDFAFVFFFDKDENNDDIDDVCTISDSNTSYNASSSSPSDARYDGGDTSDDEFAGFAGQAGCYGGGLLRRGGAIGSGSAALGAWARAATADPWRDAASAPAIARAWRAVRLPEWAAVLAAPWSFIPSDAFLAAGGRGIAPLRSPLGVVRAAIVIDAPAGARAPHTDWAILTAGANARQPDLDLFATLSRVMGGMHGVQLLAPTMATLSSNYATLLPTAFLPALAAASSAKQAAESLLWGPDGTHGELLAAALPAVTLRALPGGRDGGLRAGAGALGTILLRTARALDGLDERLHAGARHYILVSPTRYIPLPEFVIPLAIAHLPIFFIVLTDAPYARPLAGAVAAAAVALLGGAAAYVSLMHAGVTAGVAAGVSYLAASPINASACPARATELGWATGIAAAELVLAPLVLPFIARLVRGGGEGAAAAADTDDSAASHERAAVALALVAHGTVFFPLLYYNAPLTALSTAVAMPLLVAAAAAAALPKGLLRTATRAALWLVTSPANVLAWAAASGHSCAAADVIVHSVNLHATYGTSHVPLALLLWLPLHALLA